MLNATFNIKGKNLEQIVDRLYDFLEELENQGYDEAHPDSSTVSFYLEEGDD
jgi:hypothetical protein